jgi:hypothetical protein
LADEPVGEDDGELGLDLEPFARRPFPFVSRIVKTKYSSFIAASSFRNCPLARTGFAVADLTEAEWSSA